MARFQGPHRLASQICEAIGVDPNTVVRLVFTADGRDGKAEQIELTMLPGKAESGLITRRYHLVEVGDEPSAGAQTLVGEEGPELVELPAGSTVVSSQDMEGEG